MRIRDKQRSGGMRKPPKTAGTQSVSGPVEQVFSDMLHVRQSVDNPNELNELLKRIDEIGQRLAKSLSIYDLKAYQDILRGFIRSTVGNAYEIKEQISAVSNGKTKVYQRIELIGRELEELSKLVLAKQREPLKILEKLDYIRGLVVDLYS